jgi:cysteine desulfurase family protein
MIYLDNGATSFPKAPGVGEAMKRYIEDSGVNINRSEYQSSVDVGLEILDIRERLCALLGFHGDYRHIIFTSGATMSLNMIMQGLLRSGDHLIISGMEHNAVARTAFLLESKGVEVSVAPCDECGFVILESLEALFRENTRLLVVQHASNVSGTIQPMREIGALCRDKNVFLAVDTAQSAGHAPICMDDWNAAFLVFAGHKGLLGPQGIGGFIIRDELLCHMRPLISGGTGSKSDLAEMPLLLPDFFEAGTLNLPGIIGLGTALQYIEKQGISALRAHEKLLTEQFLDALRDNPHIRVPGPRDAELRTGVISVDFLRRDNSEAAFMLEEQYGIQTRCGLHCAPLAHRTLRTFPSGTVRFSLGCFNTEAEVDEAVRAIGDLC